MTTTAITNAVSGFVSRGLFQLRKHSPEILAVGGTIGVIASGVMACVATTKVNALLEEARETLDAIHTVAESKEENENENEEDKYSEEDIKKATVVVYSQTAWKFVKLYGPSVALCALSLGSLLGSNHILRQRNAALSMAYMAVKAGFDEYRNRLRERYGDQTDRELLYGVKSERVTTTVKDEETGEEKVIEATVETASPDGVCSPYAFIFDETNDYFKKSAKYNEMFLRSKQAWFNDILRINKHVFLNDVLEELGMRKTVAGQHVGWIFDPDNPNHQGDNYISFGLNDSTPEKASFLAGYEPAIWLEFNVDGDIMNLMETKEYADKFETAHL